MFDPKNKRDVITKFDVVIEKEYYPLTKDSVAAVIMVKNEKKRILVSLKSLLRSESEHSSRNYVDAIVIFDTGSIDNTLEIITNFAEENKINLYMIKGDFVDFSFSRNVMLDYAATKDINLLLLLDCNDELKNGESFKNFTQQHVDTPYNCYLLCQQWFHGGWDKYFNVRLIRNKANIRYKGVVHEYINSPVDPAQVFKHNENFTFYLYQDRTQDDDKTSKRFVRDKEMLYAEYLREPTDPRTVFYLAQTCGCLGQLEEALYYNRIRKEMKNSFPEEIFHSSLREGDLRIKLEHSWGDTLVSYMNAAEILPDRVEPYLCIAKYYRGKDMWDLAYSFIRIACEKEYPMNYLLFVDKKAYDYERWHELGRIGFYARKFKEGKMGCEKAIENSNLDIDKHNLKFYDIHEEKEKGVVVTQEEKKENLPNSIPINSTLSKKEFFKQAYDVLKAQDSSMPENVIVKKIQTLWKDK